MWERSQLKARAKQVLRTSYWKAFLVSIILGIATAGFPSFNLNLNSGSSDRYQPSGTTGVEFGSVDTLMAVIVGAIVIFIIVLLVMLAFRIFIGFPLEVGSMRYFVRAAEHNADLNQLGYAFKSGRYANIVKAMLWKAFLNFLWYLLLIIPGIVKSYAYSMVPFILADNPNIGYRRAVDLSNQMTRGHKFRIFVLDLSFLGWIILGTLALYVGVLFVMPYINATKAELYLTLRDDALRNGLTSETELRMAPPRLS